MTRLRTASALACAGLWTVSACELAKGGPEGPEGGAYVDLGGCTRTAVIEDGEDGDHQVLKQEGRSGYIYTFVDDVGSTVEPAAGKTGAKFSWAEGGANGSMYGARFAGKIGEGSIVFAGFGINFVDPKGPFDASQYSGVSFFARRGADSMAEVRLKVPDASTDPDGKVCTECFNDFGSTFEISEDWQQYTVPFQRMSQLPGWGQPRPGSVDSSKVFGMQWQVASPGADYEIWIDDIVFHGCGKR